MSAVDEIALQNAIAKIKTICADSDGRSQFFPFGGSGYKSSVTHYYESSTEISRCAVQPGSVEDLQKIVRAIADTRAPFAVKCGGHASNPGFSSTRGIQIFLARLNKITVREREKLVDVGAGVLFGELYAELAPYNLNIVGGSGLAGIGVAGWLLGGGYSVKTSQYGLGIDNIESAKIVLSNGNFAEASATQNEDLFFAIKGGGNNFGIITEFTLKAHSQERLYYDFSLTYEERHHNAVRSAIGSFVNRTDNKANLEAAFRRHKTPDGIQTALTVHCVYDGNFIVDPFSELTAIEHKIDNYGSPYPPPIEWSSDPQAYESTVSSRISSFYVADTLRSWANETYDLNELPEGLQQEEVEEVQYSVLMSGWSLPITEFVGDGKRERKKPTRLQAVNDVPARPMAGISQLPRGRWGAVMVDKFAPEIIAIIEEEHKEVAEKINTRGKGGRRVDVGFWPFTKSMFDKSPHPRGSAWPHEKDHPNCPIIVYFTWEGKDNDAFWVDAIKTTLGNLRRRVHAISPSSKDLPYFINAALAEDASVEDLYRDNLLELGLVRRRYDPHLVMNLTGGFKIPPVYPPRQQQ